MSELLSIRATARRLGISHRRVYELIRDGYLPQPVETREATGGGRVVICGIPREAVDALDGRLPTTYAERLARSRADAPAMSFDYHTYRGEVRRVWVTVAGATPTLEPTEHYPDTSPKLRAWDVDREDWRVYKLANIIRWHDAP